MVVPKRSEEIILSFMRYMAMKRSLVVSLSRRHSLRKRCDSERCLPRFFQSQGHSATATHSEYIDICVQLITSFEKETARDGDDGIVGTKVGKRGDHESAIFRL